MCRVGLIPAVQLAAGLLFIFVCAPVSASEPPGAPVPPAALGGDRAMIAAVLASPHAGSEWARLVPPATSVARALEFDRSAIFAGRVLVRVLFFAFLLTGRRAWRIQDAVRSRVRPSWLAAPATLLLFLLLYQATGLPLTYLAYCIHHHFGIAVQSPGRWAADVARTWAVDWCVLVPAMLLLIAAIRRWPRHWWLAAAALAAVISTILVYLSPLVLDPLFHRFTPLRDPPLRVAILQLASKAGVHVHGVYVGEFSATTTEGNAYVTGLGSSQRIVLWDTLLNKYPPNELQSILAHELGHYALHHILTGLLLGVAGSVLIFYLGARLLQRGLQKHWWPRTAEPAAMVPLAALVLSLNIAGMPVVNATSRMMEARADAFALVITGQPAWFIASMRRLCRQDYDNPWPNPIAKLIFYTHPSISERIHAAVLYQAVLDQSRMDHKD